MKIFLPIALLFLFACNSSIKGDKANSENPLADTSNIVKEFVPVATTNLTIQSKEDLLGFWVGWFDSAIPSNEFIWGKMTYRNKINVSIDSFVADSVFGHSVVANNYTPFKGSVTLDEFDIYNFKCVEPGNGSHDGVFTFKIGTKDSLIKGNWEAYGKVDVYKRKYSLSKQLFEYNANNQLDMVYYDENNALPQRQYTVDSILSSFGSIKKAAAMLFGVDTMEWNAEIENEMKNAMLDDMNMLYEGGDYYSTTDALFKFNPSVDRLTTTYVENLSKADIYILRNSIYAKHGYSFRKRDLRAYFDRYKWYIPVIADIRSELTGVEKENIKTLLAYEEYAEEYYDYYGR